MTIITIIITIVNIIIIIVIIIGDSKYVNETSRKS